MYTICKNQILRREVFKKNYKSGMFRLNETEDSCESFLNLLNEYHDCFKTTPDEKVQSKIEKEYDEFEKKKLGIEDARCECLIH